MTKDLVLASSGAQVAVRKWKHGDPKISVPGIYDMSMLAYHSDCCDGPSISSSGLRTIRHKTPLHYWHTSPLNPKRADETDDVESAALRKGRAAHTLLLEPELFRGLYTTRPGCWDSWRTKDAKTWRAEQTLAGLTVLDPAEMADVFGIRNALAAHPLYKLGLLDGDIERAMIWRDAKTGIWLKARPDVIPRGSNIFADLKCLRDGSADYLSGNVFKVGYDMQLALAGIGMHELLGRVIEDHVLVIVESAAPHAIRIAPIASIEIDRAMLLLRWSINKFAECWKAGDWPSYAADDNTHVYRRSYDAKWIEFQIEKGLLPQEF